MDREALINAMTQKGHTRRTAEGAIAGRGVADLWREYMGGSSGGGSVSSFDPAAYAREQQRLLEEREARQREEEGAFLGRFRAAVEGLEPLSEIRQRVIREQFPEYRNIKQGAYGATEALRKIPETVRTRAGQVGMSADRIQARIQSKISEIQPFVQDTLSKLEFIEGQIGASFQLEAADRENVLVPLRQEAAMLSDRLAREITGYTTNVQSQTTILAQKLANQGALEVQELMNLAAAAQAEQQYFQSQIVTVDGRKKLINKRTGEVIADLGTSGGGGGDTPSYVTSAPTGPPVSTQSTLQSLDEQIFGGDFDWNSVDLSGVDFGDSVIGASGTNLYRY